MFSAIPDIKSDIFLEKGSKSWFSIVFPEERTNLITNPSFELGLTGVTNVGGATSAQSSADRRRGIYSCAITMGAGTTDGIYQAITLLATTAYAGGVDVKAPAGMPMSLNLQDGSANVYGRTTWIASGLWERITLNAYTGAGTSYRLYLQKDTSTRTGTVYTDGWQVEAGAYPTTYIDGDLVGDVLGRKDFYWTGIPHASTSVRIANCRLGGKVVNLRDYGFRLTAFLGGGLTGFENKISTLATGGGYYHGTIYVPRQINLVGSFFGTSWEDRSRKLSSLISALRVDVVTPDQPCLLLFQKLNECDVPTTDILEIKAIFNPDGLSGALDNPYGEKVSLSFDVITSYLGTIQGNNAAATPYTLNVTSTSIIKQDAIGNWSALGSGTGPASAHNTFALAVGLDGAVYAGGDFTSAGGVANTNRIAKWQNGAWSALGTGATIGSVFALAIGPDGSLYAGGSFTTMGGVANTAYIAKWNGSAWSALGTGMNADVYALAFGPDGTLYAGGNFTTAGGGAATRMASWNGSAWAAMGTGTNDYVNSLVIGLDGYLYAGGKFTQAGGVSGTVRVARWNGSAWSGLAGGLGGEVFALAVGFDGVLYAGGTFTTSTAGASCSGLARWNGITWSPLSSGVSSSVDVRTLGIGPDGKLYISGNFTVAGGLSVERFVRWNGSSFENPGVDFPSSPTVWCMAFDLSKTFYLGYSYVSGNVVTEYISTLSINSKSRIYPLFKFTGPGTLKKIVNYTTGTSLFFSLTLLAGETAYLDLTPASLRFYSNFRPNLLNGLARGSNPAQLFLVPGTNYLSVSIGGTTDANTAATAQWKESVLTISDLVA